ncbi:hypothetical protein BIY24_13150 [Halobacteriovorax marinus]|uniref:hypothetical protein n=1 Tax=Halobacteriovorax marinus TaxID=97084 RepID=UPI000BC32E1A|nr:hypothetical protein [Halobacteriovorax marinus]ATH08860.1 hypothetical protein BIY24_13150 [Halobacteriovorax marinus]
MNSNSLTVALLLEDLSLAKEFSDIFRELGVVPHFYENLESFWNGTLEVLPTLSLIDVKKMHEGHLLLKNHPFVINEQMPMAFYFTTGSAPLLHSTFDFLNLGTILHGANYKGQIKSILKRLNKLLSYEQQLSNLELEKGKLSNQVRGLIEVSQVYKEDNFFEKYLKNVFARFDATKRTSFDFFSACESVFSDLADIKEFSFVELSSNGQRLVSPEGQSMKYVSIPSLFLGKTCKNGIADFAQNLSSQVAVELLGGEVMSLNISGSEVNPDIIIYLSLNDLELTERIDWTSLESHLNGIYAHFRDSGKAVIKREARFITPWEAFTLFDRQIKMASVGDIKNQYALVDIDLSSLVQAARIGDSGEFSWKEFFQDFVTRITSSFNYELKFISMGVSNIGVVCDHEHIDVTLKHLKNVSMRFSYWRYFEKSDALLTKNLKPEIKMIPASAEAYLLHIEDVKFSALDELESIAIKKKTKELVWGKAPERTL